MSESGDNYDAIANIYDDKIHAGYRERIQDQIVFTALDEQIGNNEIHILDAGGGTGHYSLPYAKRGHRITILDISSKMLEVAESKAQGMDVSDKVTTIHGDMCRTSLPDESYDFIICHLALCHVENPILTLQEFHRLLRIGGVLSLIVENREFFSMADAFRGRIDSALKNQLKEKVELTLPGLGIIRTFRRDELLSMLNEVNLKPMKIMGLRILSDYLHHQNVKISDELDSLERLETRLSIDKIWNEIGRFHFIFSRK